MQFGTVKELERFEFRWKVIFATAALILAGALTDLIVLSPDETEEVWCYAISTLMFILGIVSARRLQCSTREAILMNGSEILDEATSNGFAADVDD